MLLVFFGGGVLIAHVALNVFEELAAFASLGLVLVVAGAANLHEFISAV